MIRISLIAAVALLAAACSPQTTGAASDAPMQSADAASCATRGGTMKQVGRMQSWQCVISYADAGKRCTDGAQCQGDCRVEGETSAREGDAVVGRCQVENVRFGCFTTIANGRAQATLCID